MKNFIINLITESIYKIDGIEKSKLNLSQRINLELSKEKLKIAKSLLQSFNIAT